MEINLQSQTKDQAIKLVTDNDLTKPQLRALISGMKSGNKTITPKEVKVGDIFTCLMHPAILIKICKGRYYSLLLTSSETTIGILCPAKSRFLSESWITATIVESSKEHILSTFVANYDNTKHITEVKKLLKDYLKIFK